MNILDLNGLNVSGTAPIKATTTQHSEQDTCISAYAASFFKGLGERAGSAARSLVGRVTDFFKDLKARFETDITVTAFKDYFQGLLTRPLNDNPENLDTLETRLAALGEFVNNETLKANRALANLFYTTRAELLSRILGENKTEIVATTVAASDGRAVSDEVEKIQYLVIAGDKQDIETPQEIIEGDIKQLKARTTAQKVWDCTFDKNAKKALSLHDKNAVKLKELLRSKHEKVMKSLNNLVNEFKDPEEFRKEIDKIKPAVQEFLKEGNPFQKETQERINDIRLDLFYNASYSDDAERVTIFSTIKIPAPVNSRSSTPPLSDSDDSGRNSPVKFAE